MNFSEIVGKTLASVDQSNNERLVFHFSDGTACESVHMQDCCESVVVYHVEGDVVTLIDLPILEAEETQDPSGEPKPEHPDSWTWTRQRIRTAAGEVTFVWLGESNGYYGETPQFGITHGTAV